MNSFSVLEQGIDHWNQWRERHPTEPCDLEGQDLSHGYFFEGDFRGANLRNANLQRACLVGADFRDADLTGADLTGAYLSHANFYGANLRSADFTRAALDEADMRRANLVGTRLLDADISTAKLPAANDDGAYVNTVAMLIAENHQFAEGHVGQSRAAITEKGSAVEKLAKKSANGNSPRTARVNAEPSAIAHIIRTIKNFTHESSEDFAARQQRIRQSAIPERRSGKDRRKAFRIGPNRRQQAPIEPASTATETQALLQKAPSISF